MSDKDRIKLLTKEDFRAFCAKCEREEAGEVDAGNLEQEVKAPASVNARRGCAALAVLAMLASLAGCGDPDYRPSESKLRPPVQGSYSSGNIPYK